MTTYDTEENVLHLGKMIDSDEGIHLNKGNATYERSTSTYTRNKKLRMRPKTHMRKVEFFKINNK
jgi:hypothetical protein